MVVDINSIKCSLDNEVSNNLTRIDNFENKINILKDLLTSFRIDIKNKGTSDNTAEVLANGCKITTPIWAKDNEGQAVIVEGHTLKQSIIIKVVNEGTLVLSFKGADKRYNNERYPIWIDYKVITLNGINILPQKIETCYDKPFSYEIPVKNGQEVVVEFEITPHIYLRNELKRAILSKYSEIDSIEDIITRLKKYFLSCSDTRCRYLYDDKYYKKTDSVNNKDLKINTYENSIVLPCKFIKWGQFPWYNGGIINENRQYVEASCCDIMNGVYEYSEIYNSNDQVFYLGIIMKQWGHYLLQCLGRLWAYIENKEEYKNYKFVYVAETDISGTYMDLLNLLGILPEQLIRVTKPTKFKKIICADDCNYPIANGLHYKYKNIVADIIRNASDRVKDKTIYNKIYLSHSSWKTSSKRDIGEYLIENFFIKNGYVPISPQELTFAEQVYIINSATEIVSVLCSLSHNFIFANNNAKLTCIRHSSPYDMSDSYQRKIETLFRNNAQYIDAYMTFLPAHGARGPFLYGINDNVKLYADDYNYLLPENNNEQNIKIYLDIFINAMKKGLYTNVDIENYFSNDFNRKIFSMYASKIITALE